MRSDRDVKSVARGRRWPRYRRVLAYLALGGLLLVAALWFAVHRFDWAGPLVANSLRAVIGVDNVARLEDTVYAVEDRWNRWWRRDEKPKAYWKVPEAAPAPPTAKAVATVDASPAAPELPPFQLEAVGPVHDAWSAPGDGEWVQIVDPRRPAEPAYLYKTLLHPDKSRSWAELFIVAVDLRRVDVIPVAGTQEPKATEKAAEDLPRPAVIPSEHHEELLAAFNGGFMTEHGGYGMMVDGKTLVAAKKSACTFAKYEDGSHVIATWEKIADTAERMIWYRQAPSCMYEQGKIHPGLQYGSALKWGATLDGDTVIRRSAVGLSADRQVLYVAISNHTTARIMADGMRHAGAVDVAQLDVNWSYPKFVLFEPAEGRADRIAVALAEGFEFSEDEYIRKRSRRDFFYLLRGDTGAKQAKN
ncbi:MAG TPA: phosphodiester glycosidase family protein [Polyangiaceae bacterium]|nr:phosphodiester glycosidase family protein [Polyangiaceae bacterium]